MHIAFCMYETQAWCGHDSGPSPALARSSWARARPRPDPTILTRPDPACGPGPDYWAGPCPCSALIHYESSCFTFIEIDLLLICNIIWFPQQAFFWLQALQSPRLVTLCLLMFMNHSLFKVHICAILNTYMFSFFEILFSKLNTASHKRSVAYLGWGFQPFHKWCTMWTPGMVTRTLFSIGIDLFIHLKCKLFHCSSCRWPESFLWTNLFLRNIDFLTSFYWSCSFCAVS